MITKQDFPVSSLDIRQEIAQEIRLHRRSIRWGLQSVEVGTTAIWAIAALGEALGVVRPPSGHRRSHHVGYYARRV